MSKFGEEKQQGDLWTWIVVGLIFCTVIVALYGPFLWKLVYSA
jgi:ABC-type spermidine/putrescine transport system permease subunit II